MNGLIAGCLQALRSGDTDETKKIHAAATLGILSRSLLGKNLAGWEVMEIFAGGVSGSDAVFMVIIFGSSA